MKRHANFQPETHDALEKIPPGTVAEQSALLGIAGNEPLLIAMDGMIRYAKAYHARFESLLGEDYFLGPHFIEVINGLRGLLNGDGAVAMERGVTTDSKDNGAIEDMFWAACEAAGLDEADL